MEREIESRIFRESEYSTNKEMQDEVEEYMKKMRYSYPRYIVTKEFYKGRNILVKVIKIDTILKDKYKAEKGKQLEKDEQVRIKERGINGIGENVDKTIEHKRGGSERERC